jgi:hypothetical protein
LEVLDRAFVARRRASVSNSGDGENNSKISVARCAKLCFTAARQNAGIEPPPANGIQAT